MEKYSLNLDWQFHLGDLTNPEIMTHTSCYMAAKAGGAQGAASPDYATDGWETVHLPHDWAVYGAFEEKYGPANGYKPRGKGWYKKRFKLSEADQGKQLLVEFGGIASHAVVYCNGSVVARNFSGYNSFIADITPMAVYGEQVNELTVFVDATAIEGWWYEGAGIYRHVNLYKKNPLHIGHWGVFVHPEKKTADVWDALTDTTVENSSYEQKEFLLLSSITDEDGNVVGKITTESSCPAGSEVTLSQNILTYSPYLWDIDDPHLYTLTSELYEGSEKVDETVTSFGFRTIEVSADNGFLLNGRRVPLYGTCNHQDHAGVGVAVPDAIQEYRIRLLKEMGSNAYRCAHGNPSAELLDFCDQHGMLVMDENRNFNASPEGILQVQNMVRRDRNHPSVIMYSIFNEEPLQGTDIGRKIAARLDCEIKKLDNTRPTLGAMNTGVTADGGCADLLDITGFNYITHTYDDFRRKYPHMPMLGSENDSAFQTRGVYATDHEKHVIDCYDSEAAPWGNTYRDGFRRVNERPHILGLFIWTGFDYRGEPTPFEWPSISTQFGIMDTCGFKKDAFYLNKAFFTQEPMIHILPHWNWKGREGEEIKIMTHTNCEEAELFLNGVSLGKKKVDRYDMTDWQVPYAPGTLKMTGWIAGKEVCSEEISTTGPAKALCLEPTRAFFYSDCQDALAVNVSVLDSEGLPVPTASDLVEFSVSGGVVLGVGNGNPNSHEADKASKRHLFHGLCQAIIAPAKDSDAVTITAQANGLQSAVLTLPVRENTKKITYLPSVHEKYITTWRASNHLFRQKPDPQIKIEDHDMNNWAVVKAGDGIDEKFDQAIGFALYRATIQLEKTEKDRLISFRGITGNHVWIYQNGNLSFEGDCEWSRKVEIKAETDQTLELTVIIESTARESAGGIDKAVVIYEL